MISNPFRAASVSDRGVDWEPAQSEECLSSCHIDLYEIGDFESFSVDLTVRGVAEEGLSLAEVLVGVAAELKLDET